MPTVRGYLRVSTADQADSGLGLAAGREAITKEFDYRWKDKGFVLGPIYEDTAVSGKKPFRSRPAGLRLSNALENGDVVLIPRIDRGFRNTEDMLSTVRVWKERQIRVVFINVQVDTESPYGRLLIVLLAEFAALERDMISERTGEAVRHAVRNGRLVGGPPWGCRVKGPKGAKRYYEAIPRELDVGKLIVKWRMDGYTWDAIKDHLHANNLWARWRKGNPVKWKDEGSPWTFMKLFTAYNGTLRLMRWIESGKVKLPPKEPKENEHATT